MHVGDSRAYHLRGEKLRRLTRDQTMGAYLVDEYAMTEQQVEQQGFNNVLSSAVGAQEMTPAVSELTLEQGDSLVLCTDGLTKHVSEERIAGVIAKAENAEAGCRELVDLALEGGGKDNVTVVVANALRRERGDARRLVAALSSAHEHEAGEVVGVVLEPIHG